MKFWRNDTGPPATTLQHRKPTQAAFCPTAPNLILSPQQYCQEAGTQPERTPSYSFLPFVRASAFNMSKQFGTLPLLGPSLNLLSSIHAPSACATLLTVAFIHRMTLSAGSVFLHLAALRSSTAISIADSAKSVILKFRKRLILGMLCQRRCKNIC